MVVFVSMVSMYNQYFYPISILSEFSAEKFHEFRSDEAELQKWIYYLIAVYIVDYLDGDSKIFVLSLLHL